MQSPIRPKDRHPPGRAGHGPARALDDLRFIRETMERSQAFTALPGVGGMYVGATALVASWFASRQTSDSAWIGVWLIEAALAFTIALATLIHKARRSGTSLVRGPARRFLLAMGPACFAGIILTVALHGSGHFDVIPGLWLLLYGAAIITAGAHSVRVVPIMGVAFMALGCVASFGREAWFNECMALGFGGLHLVAGLMIARKYGG